MLTGRPRRARSRFRSLEVRLRSANRMSTARMDVHTRSPSPSARTTAFNEVCSVALGRATQRVLTAGTNEHAKAAIFYLVKYMTKVRNPNPKSATPNKRVKKVTTQM